MRAGPKHLAEELERYQAIASRVANRVATQQNEEEK
jgi:hypothetical protein